ncbi:hypothetical protein ID866_9758 [Astraeus odoratus]|nr:hypothetical protein ID866_9758 [Astraeus odoratus]
MNCILIGETGVGKSSVVNLLAGDAVAEVSSGVDVCTVKAKEYTVNVDSMCVNIWDTPGLDQPETVTDSHVSAIEQACYLIKKLKEAGGIDLLVLCIRGRRPTRATLNIYWLFYEALCGQQVPIAFVITYLEHQVEMESWWTRNEESIERRGLKCASHACVTGIPDNEGPDGKYGRSQKAIQCLLKQHVKTGKPEGEGIKPFEGDKAGITKEKDLKEGLVTRFRLSSGAAQRIVAMMTEIDKTKPLKQMSEKDREKAEPRPDSEEMEMEERSEFWKWSFKGVVMALMAAIRLMRATQ